MLATPGQLPTGSDWAYEFKWDGVRAVATVSGGSVRLHARSGADVTVAYPELAKLGRVLDDAVLDGEMVVLDGAGRPAFTLLAERMHVRDAHKAARLAASHPVTYMIFDLLSLGGVDLTGQPYTSRRAVLEDLGLADRAWLVPPYFDDGPATEIAAAENSLEGVVAKRRGSLYRPGTRSPDWVKVKRDYTEDFVVGGWRPGVRTLGALLVGVPTVAPRPLTGSLSGPLTGSLSGSLPGARAAGGVSGDGRLIFRGRVGGGISAASERALLAVLRPLAVPESPFTEALPREDSRDATWVRPEVVVEVRYGQRTPDGRLRFPRFMRLRPDKSPAECVDG